MQQGPSQRTLQEVWLEVNIEDVAAETLDRVVEGQNVYTLSVFDIEALVNVDKITQFYAEVVASDFVHLNAALLDVVRAQANKDSVASLFAAVNSVSIAVITEKCTETHRTMIVSPRKSWSNSIVAGLSVATIIDR